MTRSSGQIARRSCASRAPGGESPFLRTLYPPLSQRQRLLVTHLLDMAEFLADAAPPDAAETSGATDRGAGRADEVSRPASGRRSSATGLFRRALALANACCLEAVRRGLVGLREEQRRAGDHSRADALNALLSEVDLRLAIFRDLRIGRAGD
ncbi:MAG: hypothetical protein R6X22_14160 [Gemmatimonadota bacterium]